MSDPWDRVKTYYELMYQCESSRGTEFEMPFDYPKRKTLTETLFDYDLESHGGKFGENYYANEERQPYFKNSALKHKLVIVKTTIDAHSYKKRVVQPIVETDLAIPLNDKQLALVENNADALGLTIEQYALVAITQADVSQLIGGVSGPVQCAGCAAVFDPARRPRADQLSWCDDCRAAGRDRAHAVRQFRARQRRETNEKPAKRPGRPTT